MKKNDSFDKKSIIVTRNQFLSQGINSCHKKSILTTRNQSLSLEIISVKSHPSLKLFYQFATACDSYKKICLSFYILLEPGSQVPLNLPLFGYCTLDVALWTLRFG